MQSGGGGCGKPRKQPERLVEAFGLIGTPCRRGSTGKRDELSSLLKQLDC